MRTSMLVLLMAVLTLALTGCTRTAPYHVVDEPAMPTGDGPPEQLNKITVLMVPKIKGTDYFTACERGAEQAAKELGSVDLIFDGPTEDKVDAQIQLIEGYIAQDIDVIAVSPNDPDSIAPVLKKARDKGIHVITWDADADPDKSGRELFVNQATESAIAKALVDEMALQAGASANVAIITASLTAANQNAWITEMQKYVAQAYPGMTFVCDPKPSEEDQALAFKAAQELMKTYPDLDGIFAISSAAFPGAADAVQQAGKVADVAVVGLATPKPMRQWVDSGVVDTVILWNPIDLGYLTVYAARALADGGIAADTTEMGAGRLGEVEIQHQNVLLGEPMRFTKENIADFDF